ncbi:MAG: M56 family metallopeptidase [Lachnospiraceae bacterium]|nr:M56 family metallopeptidase [Lachnospiraceae bacterium]
MPEFLDRGISFLNICAIYYVIQLIRCAIVSLVPFAFVFLLRKTLLKNRVFLKGALWSLFIPVFFAGKMKFFYENTVGVILFTWWTVLLTKHVWINWLYLCVAFIFGARLICGRRKLKKLVAGMEKRNLDGNTVYVAKMPVTPSAIGVLRPKIIMPALMWKEYDQKELQTILLHEKTHIRLGHLLFYFLWDMSRVLLWVNPLFTMSVKLLREDMEEICDWATMQQSEEKAYVYGKLLLKSMRVLQVESKNFNMFAAFSGDKEYTNIRQRVTQISQYRPYKRIAVVSILTAVMLCIMGLVVWIQSSSYDRYNENDTMFIYGYDGKEVTFFEDSDLLRQMISYDDTYVYVGKEAFEDFLQKINATGDVFIVFGGFYKLPGFVGTGYSCYYESDDEEPVVRILYEKPTDDWLVALVKVL